MTTSTKRGVIPYNEVLGGGGNKGIAHAGYLDVREELNLPVSHLTGVSVGGLVGMMSKNGMSGKEIKTEFLKNRKRLLEPLTFLLGVAWFDPLAFWTGSIFTLEKLMAQFVKEYKFEPKDDLTLVAFDVINRKRVDFTGTNYDPVQGLVATGAIPGFFRPVFKPDGRVLWMIAAQQLMQWWTLSAYGTPDRYFPELRPEILVDGAMYHFNPTERCDTTAIVSRLGRVRVMPTKPMLPADFAMYLRELTMQPSPHTYDIDTSKHVLVHTDLPSHGALVFGYTEADYEYMFAQGQEAAREILTDPAKLLRARKLIVPETACV